jgi:RNA polymerase sigma factor (sigma-70 family)
MPDTRLTRRPSTTQLVERAQAGDVEAFTELVREHQDRAYAAALTMLSDRGCAQDAVQDAFLLAFGSLRTLRSPEAFGAWLRQIVRRQASRILRQQPFEMALHQDLPSGMPDPADTAERRDELRRVLRAIDELPEGEREATILFYLKDQSQKTVASLLHLPITTVNNRLHAARARLKGELLPVMGRILAQHALPADFADAVGRIVRVAGSFADGVPAALARLGAHPSGTEPLETGIKVIDLLCPIADGGSLGLFGDPRVGKLVLVDELAHNLGKGRRQPVIFTFVKAPDEVDVYSKLLADAGPLPTVVIAADEASEGALKAARPFLDAAVFMSRQRVDEGIYPAVDPRQSWSRLLDPAFVGADHWEVAQGVLKALGQVDAPGAKGARGRRIRNFLSQPFFVAEAYTKRPGVFVPRQETIAAFAALLSGSYDHLPEEVFLTCGPLQDAVGRASRDNDHARGGLDRI